MLRLVTSATLKKILAFLKFDNEPNDKIRLIRINDDENKTKYVKYKANELLSVVTCGKYFPMKMTETNEAAKTKRANLMR